MIGFTRAFLEVTSFFTIFARPFSILKLIKRIILNSGAFLLSILVRFLARGQSLYAVLKYSPGFIGFGAALALLGSVCDCIPKRRHSSFVKRLFIIDYDKHFSWKIVYSIPIALFTTFSIKNGKPGDK